MLQRPFAPFQRLFWTRKLPPDNHRALKLFEFTSFFSSTKVSPQCFYFLQVFHSSKQQIGLSDLHGVPCTNLGRDFFFEGLSFLLRPMACRFSGFGTSFGGRQTLRQHPERNPGFRAIWNTQTAVFRTCEAKDKKLRGATLTKYLHTYQFTVPKHTPHTRGKK